MLNNRLYLSASVLFISAFLVSCQREADVISYAPQITAKAEQPATRTVLSVNEDGQGTIYWKPADRINVFFGKTRALYSSQNKDDATTAVFQTTDSISESDFSSTNIWGLYPADDASTSDGSSVTTTLPSQQYGISETFDDDLFITLAHSSSTTLQFYNVCGGIKFSLSRDDIKSITLRGNYNEDLAGKVKLSFSDGLPKATVVNGVKEITLRPKSGQSFSKGVNYYFVTLPVAMSAGFTMTFTTTGGSVGTLNYTGNAVTLKRSIFSRQNHIDLYASFEDDSQVNNVIYYTSSGGVVVTPNKTDVFGASIVSNEYVNGKGVITFDADVTGIGTYAFYGCSNLLSLELPNSVTSIDDYAFYGCSNLVSIDIPDSVTRIGNYAFRSCYNLTSIEIPNSVTSISNTAFNACSGLTSMKVLSGNPVYDSRNNCNAIIETDSNTLIAGCRNSIIPSTVLSVGDYAFSGCSTLTSIAIPNSVTSIGNYAFRSCSGLTSITIPSSVTSIGNSPFSGCYNLKSIVVDSGNPVYDSRNNCNAIIETNSNMLIVGCKNSVIPNSVTSIGDSAFYGCSSLTSMVIPNSVTSIGNEAFYGCSSLASIEIPNSVNSIGNYAFRSCYNLTTVEIPASVTSIGHEAFYGCQNLTSITVLATTPPSVGNNVFNNTNNCPIYVPAGSVDTYKSAQGWNKYADRISPLPTQNNVIYYTSSDGKIVTPYKTDVFGANIVSNEYVNGQGIITFDTNVTSIGELAFYHCGLLTSIEIPNSVTKIGYGAFWGTGLVSLEIPYSVTSIGTCISLSCRNLEIITVDIGNSFYDSRNNCNAIIMTKNNTLIAGCRNTVIPDSVIYIGDSAFYGCNITSIEIPSSVKSIARDAFSSCKNLTSIDIPNSVTFIGNEAFFGCSALNSIIIPNSVSSIGNGVFEGCSSLISIVVSSNNSTYDSRNNCNAIIETASSTLIAGCQNTIIPNSVLRIAKQAFRYCYNLTSIEIPNSVTSIGDIAFEGCRDLTSITVFAATPPSVGNSVFNETNNCLIYVPSESINTYQSAQGWSEYADRIQGAIIFTLPPSTEIWYESYSGKTIPLAQSSSYLVSNTYSNGKGVYKFSRELSSVDKMFDYSEICYTTKENEDFKSLILPPSITSIPSFGIAHLNYATKLVLPYNLSSLGSDSFCRFGEQTPETSNIYFIGKKAPSFVSTSIWNLHDLVSGGNKVDNLYYPENNSSYNSLLNIEVQGSAKHYWIPTKYIIHFSE